MKGGRMPAPLLVPLILLGGATIALAAASAKKKGAGGDVTPASGRTYTLDANMPPAVRDQVLAALMTEQDPARLEAFAAAIGASYPLAAAALRTKAAMLRPPPVPQPTPPRVDPPP